MTSGPGRHSSFQDRVHIPESGLSPGEVSSSHLTEPCGDCFESSGKRIIGPSPLGQPVDPFPCDTCGGTGQIPVVLEFSHDWAEALGWRDPPEVTTRGLFEVAQWVATHHGYQVAKDLSRSKPTDWQNNGPKMIRCRCGSGQMPCEEFERYRRLLWALGAGEGHNSILAAKYSSEIAAEQQTLRLLRQQLTRLQAENLELKRQLQTKIKVDDILSKIPYGDNQNG